MSNLAYINKIGAALPNDPVGNDEIEAVLGMIGGKPSRAKRIVLRSNGIQTRHYVIDRHTGQALFNNAQLTAEAVRQLEGNGFRLSDIECLSCGTSSPDYIQPSHGLMVAGELKLPPCEVVATGGICMSGVASLKYAYLNVIAGLTSNAVATGSEVVSTVLMAKNFAAEAEAQVEALQRRPEIAFGKEFLRWMLSDGAGAMLVQNRPNEHGLSLRIDWIEQRSYAGEMDACMYAGAEKQPDGSLKGWREFDTMDYVFENSLFTVQQDVHLLDEHVLRLTMERGLSEVLEKHPFKPDSIDYFVPHYSSLYFRDKVRDSMRNVGFEIPQERWFTNLPRVGNVGSAAIYLMLEELMTRNGLEADQRILCYIPESSRFSTSFVHLTVVES